MDEIDGAWFRVVWKNWHEPGEDQKLYCHRWLNGVETGKTEKVDNLYWDYVQVFDCLYPATIVWARTYEEACDRAGKVFDRENHKIKR